MFNLLFSINYAKQKNTLGNNKVGNWPTLRGPYAFSVKHQFPPGFS